MLMRHRILTVLSVMYPDGAMLRLRSCLLEKTVGREGPPAIRDAVFSPRLGG